MIFHADIWKRSERASAKNVLLPDFLGPKHKFIKWIWRGRHYRNPGINTSSFKRNTHKFGARRQSYDMQMRIRESQSTIDLFNAKIRTICCLWIIFFQLFGWFHLSFSSKMRTQIFIKSRIAINHRRINYVKKRKKEDLSEYFRLAGCTQINKRKKKQVNKLYYC